MNNPCLDFRAALERSLGGRTSDPSELAWHEHLLSCAECRTLLESEQALDLLLATLPVPRLPDALAARLLVRLRHAREVEHELDTLLALDGGQAPPAGLATRVLAGLAVARGNQDARAQARLDRLLERAGAVQVPAALASRTLARLAEERALARREARLGARPVPRALRSRWLVAMAAGVLIAMGAWFWFARTTPEAPVIVDGPPRPGPAQSGPFGAGQADDAPSDELLAALDVLEDWDALMREDLDLLLSTFGPADEYLLELETGEEAQSPAKDNGSAASPTGERKG